MYELIQDNSNVSQRIPKTEYKLIVVSSFLLQLSYFIYNCVRQSNLDTNCPNENCGEWMTCYSGFENKCECSDKHCDKPMTYSENVGALKLGVGSFDLLTSFYSIELRSWLMTESKGLNKISSLLFTPMFIVGYKSDHQHHYILLFGFITSLIAVCFSAHIFRVTMNNNMDHCFDKVCGTKHTKTDTDMIVSSYYYVLKLWSSVILEIILNVKLLLLIRVNSLCCSCWIICCTILFMIGYFIM